VVFLTASTNLLTVSEFPDYVVYLFCRRDAG
jgi:hypothetical protein